MAIQFDKCIFEILAKLSAAELAAVCAFIDKKIDILEAELHKALAANNTFDSQLASLERVARAAEAFIDSKVASSSLLSIARALSPNCGSLADLFQGAIEAGNLSATMFADATYIIRQIKNRDGLIQTAKNEAEDAISALHDICTIIRIAIVTRSTGGVENFFKSNQSLPTKQFIDARPAPAAGGVLPQPTEGSIPIQTTGGGGNS